MAFPLPGVRSVENVRDQCRLRGCDLSSFDVLELTNAYFVRVIPC